MGKIKTNAMSMDAPQTAQQYAESIGKKWKTAQRQLNRKGLPSAAGQLLTDEIQSVIDGKKTPVTKQRTVKAVTVTNDKIAVLSPGVHYVPTETKTADAIQVKIKSTSGQSAINDKATWWTGRNITLVGLLVSPTIASVRNLYAVCLSVMGEVIGAAALTIVICVTGGALTYIGIKNKLSWFLVGAVLAFETLANVTIIYDGLMGGIGNPTRFLGVVTNIFNTGTHGTAIALGVSAALLLVGAQFASLTELNKK